MKKILKILVIVIFVTSLLGCQDKYHETYTLRYYYIEGCANCEFFTKKGIPLIEKEFGKHMKIVKYNMDDATSFDKVKKAYDHDLEQLQDFDYDQYGVGPFLVLENHYVQLGVYVIMILNIFFILHLTRYYNPKLSKCILMQKASTH